MLREDRTEAKLVRILEEIKDPSRKKLKKLEAALLVGHPDAIVGKHRELITKALNKQITQLQTMCDRLYDDKLAGYISQERYTEKYQRLQEQSTDIHSRLARLYEIQRQQTKQESAPQSENPIANLYLQSSPSQKRTIIAQLYKVVWADGDQVGFAVNHPRSKRTYLD